MMLNTIRNGFVVLSLVFSLLLLVGCGRSTQGGLLVKAESFLISQPDSADKYLSQIDVRRLVGKEENAHYALLQVILDIRRDNGLHHDSLARVAYSFYMRKTDGAASGNDTYLRRAALAAWCMGEYYAMSDSVKKSEDCYRLAISCSERLHDWQICWLAYAGLAKQVKWADSQEALHLSKKAIEAFSKTNGKVEDRVTLFECAANYYSQVAYRYNVDSCYENALQYARKALALAVDSCSEHKRNEARATLANIYWIMDDYAMALECVKDIRIESLFTKYDQTMNMKIAKYYICCDSLEKAKSMLQAPRYISDKNIRYHYARALAEIAVRTDMPNDTIMHYMHHAFVNSEAEYFDALQAKHDYYQEVLQMERKNERLMYANRLRNWVYAGLLLIVIVIGLFGGWMAFLRVRVHRERRRSSIMQRKHELERSMVERRLVSEREQAMAESQRKKTATIRHLQNYIIEQTDVIRRLKGSKAHIKLSSREWDEVMGLLDEIDNNCISRIRELYKGITDEEVQLCVMVRLGMSNISIGNVFCISISAVQHRKQALKKKRFGISDPNVSLDEFIGSL